MEFLRFEHDKKEYKDFVESIPHLQQQLLEASQTFLRPKNHWENKAAREIQRFWRFNQIRKLRRPDPDMVFFGSGQWSWRICESDYDKFNLIISQPVDTIKDSLVKKLREEISSYETYLDDKDSKICPGTRTYNDATHELQYSLRQLVTYKLIFEYSKSHSSNKELLLAYHELKKQRMSVIEDHFS